MKVRVPHQGMGAGPSNIQAVVKKMQEDMANKQAELEACEYDVNVGGGVVTVTMNGKKEIEEIVLKPEVVDPDDIETLQDLIMVAVNDAIKQADDMMTEGMSELTGGLNIPGLF